MSESDLASGLSALGIDCAVEARGKLAIITPTSDVMLDARARRVIVAQGRAHGFTNVCLELSSGFDAALPGD